MEAPHTKKLQVKYILILSAIWLVLALISFSFILKQERSKVETKSQNIHDKIYRHITDLIKTYEFSIENFASFIATEQTDNYERTRHFSKQLRRHYPDIYSLEIARHVTHNQLNELEEKMRESGYRNFKIHTFGSGSDNNPTTLPAKDVYYPVVFLEPEFRKSKSMLGLDLSDGSSILKDALERSFNEQTHVASRPFELTKGKLGYVLYRGVSANETESTLELTPGQKLYALLVVDTSKFIPEWAYKTKGLSISLQYPDIDAPHAGSLIKLNVNTEEIKSWYSWLLPDLSKSSELNSPSQPFMLFTQYTHQGSDLDLKTIAIYIIVMLVTFPLVLWLSIVLSQKKIKSINDQRKNYHLANYDWLTGLPNIQLARELFTQSASILKQNKKKLALIYIDLNELKQINDEYSHRVGDMMLQRASEYLRNTIHESDTLARLHGAKFLLLITNINNPSDVEIVIDNIKAVFDQPLILGGTQINISICIGASIYPDDGELFEDLLDAGDQDMYQDKVHSGFNVVQLYS